MTLEVDELESGVLAGTLVAPGADGQPILPLDLTAFTVTLYGSDTSTSEIINSRDDFDLLASGDVTYTPATGAFTWFMRAEDNPILNPKLRYEAHRALFRFTWDPNGVGHHEARIRVKNLRRAP